MYAPARSKKQLDALSEFGFTEFDFSKAVEIWPENLQAIKLFSSLSTQWRVGPGGASGLDYAAVYPLMDRLNLAPDEWDLLLSDVQTLEGAALIAMAAKD